jgi:hypothetical protein
MRCAQKTAACCVYLIETLELMQPYLWERCHRLGESRDGNLLAVVHQNILMHNKPNICILYVRKILGLKISQEIIQPAAARCCNRARHFEGTAVGRMSFMYWNDSLGYSGFYLADSTFIYYAEDHTIMVPVR